MIDSDYVAWGINPDENELYCFNLSLERVSIENFEVIADTYMSLLTGALVGDV